VLNFLKKAVDEASADQRGAISAIYLLLFATLDQPLVDSASKAP
jgi:hypothetical protein